MLKIRGKFSRLNNEGINFVNLIYTILRVLDNIPALNGKSFENYVTLERDKNTLMGCSCTKGRLKS